MIIGVVGTFASGKDTVAKYLDDSGFNHVSSGDVLRQYIIDNNLGGLERDNLFKVANKTRAEKGSDFFVRDAIEHWPQPLVISGIRSVGEAEAVISREGIIIAVDAPVTRRYHWAKMRGRIDDSITEEKFKQQEEAEFANTDPSMQQIMTVMGMAQFSVSNDGTLEELYAQVDEILKRITPQEEE